MLCGVKRKLSSSTRLLKIRTEPLRIFPRIPGIPTKNMYQQASTKITLDDVANMFISTY